MNALETKSGASPDLARVFLWGSVVFFSLLLLAQIGLWTGRGEAMYRVHLSHLEAANLPDWAPQLWKGEIAKTLQGAESFSVFDHRALDAARTHLASLPFVAQVDLVRRVFPRAVGVNLTLRRPIALVRRAGRVYPVDRDGILLPGKPEDAKGGFAFSLPVISGRPFAKQPAQWGERWIEDDLQEGLAVAEEIDPILDLHPGFRIVGIDLTNLGGKVSPFESEIVLLTDAGTKIFWGRASRKKPYGELAPEFKRANLQRALDEFPALKGVSELDLRFDRPAIHLKRG